MEKYEYFYISKYLIKRVWYEGERWYSITDIILFLTRTKKPFVYVQLLIRRKGLKIKIETNSKKFLIQTNKGKRMSKCVNMLGLGFIMCSLPKKYRWRVKIFRKRINLISIRYKDI